MLMVVVPYVSARVIDGYVQTPIDDDDTFSISGWACLVGNPSSISVSILAGDSRSNAKTIKSLPAQNQSENAVKERCQSDGNHRFTITLAKGDITQFSGKKLFIKAKSGINSYWLPSVTQAFFPESKSTRLIGHVQAPKGDHLSFSISGWGCGVESEKPIYANLYIGKTLQGAKKVFSVLADGRSEDEVRNRCQTSAHHRFSFKFPQSLVYEYSGQKIFVQLEGSGRDKWVDDKGRYHIPTYPISVMRGRLDGIKDANGGYFASGWSCQTNVDAPVRVRVFTRDSNNRVVNLVQGAIANTVAEQGVADACRNQRGRNRFRVKLPNDVVNKYAGSPIWVESSAVYGSGKAVIKNSGNVNIPFIPPRSRLSSNKPNIIVFFTDDQGYADLGIQDVLFDVKTPRIDALAQNGARFTQGYVTAPQCSPSRAALLTGRHQARFGMDENQYIPMDINEVTIASKIREQGYVTGMFGKWHLEITASSNEWGLKNYPEVQPFRPNQVPLSVRHDYYPHKRGFDEMIAGYSGTYLRNVDTRGKIVPVAVHRSKQFRVDLVSDASTTFIDKHWEHPFFLYVSYYAPHVPLEATQKYLAQLPKNMPLRRRYALAMLASIDHGVGRVVDKLNSYSLLENTLILFISDNGAPLGDDMTDSPITNTREAWNGSRNDPFVGEKGMLSEGALRVPYIAHWPKRIPPGLEIDVPVSTLDAAYTVTKASGESDLKNFECLDLIALIDGLDEPFINRPLYWRFSHQRAIRQGDWKYMQVGTQREYLFDMTQPEPEQNNLINSYPDIASELKAKYWNWSNQMQRPELLLDIPEPFKKRVDLFLP
jgi:arylsulfatase A-like enzyme